MIEVTVPETLHKKRLDTILSKLIPEHSREYLKQHILRGQCTINEKVCMRPNTKLSIGDIISIEITPQTTLDDQPEPIDFPILFEDSAIIIIDKPANLVVHPAAGHATGTLMNGLLHHHHEAKNLPRAGIVHRLDKDTTGLMVVAKTMEAYTHLVRQLESKEVEREYTALVYGQLISGMTIDAPIGRHPVNRLKMAVLDDGKDAVSHVRVKSRFDDFSILTVYLETGRTHQIRVHLTSRGYPLVGDKLYRNRSQKPKGLDTTLSTAIDGFNRQALHATRLTLLHPTSEQPVTFQSNLPDDMTMLFKTITKFN